MQITLSTTGSQTKPKLNNLIFHTVDLQLEELKERLEDGYTFSGLYSNKGEWKNTGKGVLKNHYIGSYTVNIDLDEESVRMEEKLEQITLLPTLAYKTFSNDDYKGKYRYRFIYVFDTIILGESNYEKIFNEICCINHLNYDRNAKVGYKLFHGTDKAVLITGKTYKPSNFKCNLNCDDCGLCMTVSTTSYQFESKEFEKDFARMHFADIVEKYKGIYRNIQQSQLPSADSETPVIELPDDFFEIVRPWKKGMEKNEIVRIKNHCHRRIKLYNNLVIRRLITPTLTFDELVYALCFEMAYFIDNSDRTDYITRQQLIGIAENAMVADITKFNYIKPRKSIVNYRYTAKYGLSKKQVRSRYNGQKNAQNNTQIKKNNSEIINRFYNPNLTIAENIDYIEDMSGIRLSDKTIRNWKKDNGLTREYNSKMKEKTRKKFTIDEQDAMFNSMADKSAKSIMAEMGVSQKTAYRIIERNNATSTTQQPKTEIPIVAKIDNNSYIEKESNKVQSIEKEIIKYNNSIENQDNMKQDMDILNQLNQLKEIVENLSGRVEELKKENETLKAQLKQTCTFIRHHCINENSSKSSQIEVNNETTEAVDEINAVEPLNEPGAMVVPQEGEVQPQSQEMQENGISEEVDVINLSDDKNESKSENQVDSHIDKSINYIYYEDCDEDTIAQIISLEKGHLLRHKPATEEVEGTEATVEAVEVAEEPKAKKNTLTPWEWVKPQEQVLPF